MINRHLTGGPGGLCLLNDTNKKPCKAIPKGPCSTKNTATVIHYHDSNLDAAFPAKVAANRHG